MNPVVWKQLKMFLLARPKTHIELSKTDIHEVVTFLEFLQEAFYAKYQFSRAEVLSHRARSFWKWGRHALALSYRHNGRRDLGCRLSLFANGIELLGKTVVARTGLRFNP